MASDNYEQMKPKFNAAILGTFWPVCYKCFLQLGQNSINYNQKGPQSVKSATIF